jgi:prolyl-tRNA editing enzyme YbaK/EbsC (Cys-tRNA(Pro) deacylase)
MDDREHLDQVLGPLGVPYELFPCDPALADTAAFCAAYGFAPEDSANTIVVIGKADPPRFAACVVLAPNRLDVNRVVRDRIGTRKASFAPADVTREITGMEIGGVTVFGLPEQLPIWVDARVMDRARIVLGGGSRSTSRGRSSGGSRSATSQVKIRSYGRSGWAGNDRRAASSASPDTVSAGKSANRIQPANWP